MKIILFGIATFTLISGHLFGQVEKWDIVTFTDQPYNEVILHDVSNDTLYVKAYGKVFSVSIDSIYYLKRDKSSLGGAGIIFGMTIGGITAYEISRRSSAPYHGFNVFLGVIGGGIAGFVVGEALGADEYCYLRSKSHQEKVKLLSELIGRNKNREK